MGNIFKLFIRRWETGLVLAIAIILAASTITIASANSLMEGAWNLRSTGFVSLIKETASYIIWKEGSTYYRNNSKTGTTDDSSSNAATLINRAISSLTTGLIYLEGNDETWVISSSIVFDGRDIDIYSEPTLEASANFIDNSMIF
jgi:hypothetical protein